MAAGLIDETAIQAITDDSGSGDDGTIIDQAWMESLVDDLEKGWFVAKGDAQPIAQFDGTVLGLLMGPGVSTAPDMLVRRMSGPLIGIRNAADSAYGDFRARDIVANTFKLATTGTITDDDFMQFTPNEDTGILLLNARATGYKNASGVFVYDTSGTAFMEIIAQVSTDIEVTTGALTGTTGTDVKCTVSAHTDGDIYIENRLGVSISLGYTLLGE